MCFFLYVVKRFEWLWYPCPQEHNDTRGRSFILFPVSRVMGGTSQRRVEGRGKWVEKIGFILQLIRPDNREHHVSAGVSRVPLDWIKHSQMVSGVYDQKHLKNGITASHSRSPQSNFRQTWDQSKRRCFRDLFWVRNWVVFSYFSCCSWTKLSAGPNNKASVPFLWCSCPLKCLLQMRIFTSYLTFSSWRNWLSLSLSLPLAWWVQPCC